MPTKRSDSELSREALSTKSGEVNHRSPMGITGRREADARMEGGSERYRQLFENAKDAILILDTGRRAGEIVSANPSAAAMHGYTIDELLTLHISDLISFGSNDEGESLMRRLMQEEWTQEELVHRRKDGTIFHVSVNTGLIRAGGSKYIMLFARDITERKQAEMNLKTAYAEIAALKEKLEAERSYLREEIKCQHNHEAIIGNSDELKYVLYKVEQIAATDTTVLLLGETGTGKELAARAIHGLSLRKDRAFMKLNCATLPSDLMESELFGHEKGAFTGAHAKQLGRFEVANGATLFLDEIGELPLALQPKLLRVLQDGEFERLGSPQTIKSDVRIIAATNRNLEEEVAKNRFRQDLWYRLNVFPITLPPLRDRVGDIPLLVEFYIKKISKRLGKTIESIPKNVMDALREYSWPGNIRELENVLERAVIHSSGPRLHLMDELKKPHQELSMARRTLEDVEREYILRVLTQTRWKVGGKNGAAELLGLERSTLRARMRKLGIVKL